MYNITEIQNIIDKEVALLTTQLNCQPQNLYEPIQYILSLGGKRIRPALTLLSCNLFSETIQPALYPALALELFHNFTLMHDDIMDKSPIRRGKPTVHEKWNENVAILSGDTMTIFANQILEKTEERHFSKVFRLFNKTSREVCEGQQYDMNFEKQNLVTIPEYINMISLKTSVLLAACMKTGAICGDASEEQAELLYNFGKNLGIAFQLQDDYLDTFGNTETFGKKVGNDIATNKKTFLYLKALEKANSEQKQKLVDLYSIPQINIENKIQETISIFNSLHIKEETETAMKEFHNKAMEYFEKVNVSKERKQEIRNLADSLMKREK